MPKIWYSPFSSAEAPEELPLITTLAPGRGFPSSPTIVPLIFPVVCEKAIETQKEVIKHFEQYNFHLLTQVIHSFCVNELGSFYLDVIKDRQYTCKKESKERVSAQQSMFFLTI